MAVKLMGQVWRPTPTPAAVIVQPAEQYSGVVYDPYAEQMRAIAEQEEQWLLAEKFVEKGIPVSWVKGGIGEKMSLLYKYEHEAVRTMRNEQAQIVKDQNLQQLKTTSADWIPTYNSKGEILSFRYKSSDITVAKSEVPTSSAGVYQFGQIPLYQQTQQTTPTPSLAEQLKYMPQVSQTSSEKKRTEEIKIQQEQLTPKQKVIQAGKKVVRGIGDIFSGATYVGTIFTTPTTKTGKELREEFKIMTSGKRSDIILEKGFQPLLAEKQGKVPAKIITTIMKPVARLSESYAVSKNLRQEAVDTEKKQQIQMTKIEDTIKNLSELEKQFPEKEVTPEQYEKYRAGYVSEIAKLESYGVKVKPTTLSTGETQLEFESKYLDKKIAPSVAKFMGEKTFTKTEKGLIGAGYVSYETLVSYGIFRGLGQSGALMPLVRAGIKFPKATKILGAGLITTAGISSAYTGYKLGKQEGNMAGQVVTQLGGTAGQFAGAYLGGYKGTKAYVNKTLKKIESGFYTKSIKEGKKGVEYYDLKSGKFRQARTEKLSELETRIPQSDLYVVTKGKLRGVYFKSKGMKGVGDLKATTEIYGKSAKGMPKKIKSIGTTLETKEMVRLKMQSASAKGKTVSESEFLIRRAMLGDKTLLKVKGLTIKELKYLSYLKQIGQAINYPKGKQPSRYPSDEQLIRFLTYKGKGAVAQPWEFPEATGKGIYSTKQIVFETKTKSNKVMAKIFKSYSRSQGMGVDVLKEKLKLGKIKINVKSLLAEKKGQILIPKFQEPKIKFTMPDIEKLSSQSIKSINAINIREASIVAGKYYQGIFPKLLPVTANVVALNQLLKQKVMTKQVAVQKLTTSVTPKLSQIPKVTQIPRTTQIPKVTQIPRLTTLLTTRIVTPPVHIFVPPTPRFAVPFIPKMPQMSGYAQPRYRKGVALKKRLLYYVSDFTSKALDLNVKMTRQAVASLPRIEMTGLELRPKVRLKY